jgi:exonuclease III
MKRDILTLILCFGLYLFGNSQTSITILKNKPLKFDFNGNTKSEKHEFIGDDFFFEKGLEGQCLSVKQNNTFNNLKLNTLSLNSNESFSIQFWIKTTSKTPTVFLSQKEFRDKGIMSQKKPGWALYSSGGALGWSIGSGKRRLNYERDNGYKMPLADGKWHQITMTYSKKSSEIRLYFDTKNIAVYNVGFEFINENPIVIGSQENNFDYASNISPSIEDGAKSLQRLVNEFNKLNVGKVTEGDFLNLLVDPKGLYLKRVNLNKPGIKNIESQKIEVLDTVNKIHNNLYYNSYVTTQNHSLTKLKPITKLYNLKNDKVSINSYYAKLFGEQERLYPSNFSIDNLIISPNTISEEDILNQYKKHKEITPSKLEKKVDTLTVAVWNIWHGGKHFTKKNDGWDSRLRIAEILKKSSADIILMQETYSSGDFIAAELGYYFATTSDWDYAHQGSNISVLSKYPIKELEVNSETEFMNVSVKLTLSNNQEVYAMSNWYGMSSFDKVYDFHSSKFDNTNTTPILFGGDFNAIPHTDGGNSKASVRLLDNGFIDAYRNLHPDIKTFPGYTHEWGERIDQLYYKGNGLKNIKTEVISTAFGGFPSDHFMILSQFVLKD